MVIPHFSEIGEFRADIGLFNFVFPVGYIYPAIRIRGFFWGPPPNYFVTKIPTQSEDFGRGENRSAIPIFTFPAAKGAPECNVNSHVARGALVCVAFASKW